MYNLGLLGVTTYGQKWVNIKHNNGEFEGLIPVSAFVDLKSVVSAKVVLSNYSAAYNIEITIADANGAGTIFLPVAEECACNLNDSVNLAEVQVKRLVRGSAVTALTVENCTVDKVEKYRKIKEYCIKCIW